MKHTLIILYILITSGALILLNNSLKETNNALKSSEKNLETLSEVIMHHEAVLNDHRGAILIMIEKLNNLYM
jgi:hypothetical protein